MTSGAGTEGMDRNGQLEERRDGGQLAATSYQTELGWCEAATSEHTGDPHGLSRLTAKSLTQICLCVELLPYPKSH